MIGNSARVEGTLAALREEWNDTQARLKVIEDAIRAVSLLLDSTPSSLFGGSGLAFTPPADLSIVLPRSLDRMSSLITAGKSVASGSQRAVFSETPGSAADGKSVASVADDPIVAETPAPDGPPSRGPVSRRRPLLRYSILRLLKDKPTMWSLDALVDAMREQQLVGGTSDKTIKETIRQTANKMAAEGEIRRRGSEYGWPPGWGTDVAATMTTFLEDLVKHGDALQAQPVGEQARHGS